MHWTQRGAHLLGTEGIFPAMNGDVDPSTMKMVLFYPVIFSNFAIFWRYLEGLDISKKNIWGYMGPRNTEGKVGFV